ELGDEARIREITQGYVRARAHSTQSYWDGIVLRALRGHHVMPDAAIDALVVKWRPDSTDLSEVEVWLKYDAMPVGSEAAARDALGRANAHALARLDDTHAAELGRV